MPVFPWASFGAAVPEQMPLLGRVFADALMFAARDSDPHEESKHDEAAVLPAPVPEMPLPKKGPPLSFRFAIPPADPGIAQAAKPTIKQSTAPDVALTIPTIQTGVGILEWRKPLPFRFAIPPADPGIAQAAKPTVKQSTEPDAALTIPTIQTGVGILEWREPLPFRFAIPPADPGMPQASEPAADKSRARDICLSGAQAEIQPNAATELPAIAETMPTRTVPPLRFRFARWKPVETDEGKSDAAIVPNQAPLILPPNLEPVPAPESVAPKPEAPFVPPASPTVQAEAGDLRSGELAFAAKLTPAAVGEPQAITAPATKNSEAAPVKPQLPVYRPAPPEAVAAPLAHPVAQPHHHAAESEHVTETREIPRPIEIPPEPAAAKPAEGLRDISLRLVDGSKEQVEIRLVERAGELRVSVRSADSQLNTELRSGLGDLAGKLEKTGFHAETWHPSNEHAKPAEAAQTGNSKQDQESRHHGGQQHPERREPRGPRKIRPGWVEEMNRDFPIGDVSR